MGVQVAFIYAQFIAAFPEFTNPPGPTETAVTTVYEPLAEVYCRNDGGGPVTSATLQIALLNMMTAHVTALLFGMPNYAGGVWTFQPSPLVGRVNQASEGSVSVSVDMPSSPNSAWFNQTKYGAMYWQAILPLRLGKYIPVTPNRNPTFRAMVPFPYG